MYDLYDLFLLHDLDIYDLDDVDLYDLDDLDLYDLDLSGQIECGSGSV